jgi:hypothetical protein
MLEFSPSKRQVNFSLSNQSALSSVILVLLWYSSGYIIVYLPFLSIMYVLHAILFWEYYILSRKG